MEARVLVLARRKGESIVIGDDIYVTVVDVSGDRIRLGITAPRDVRVDRTEVRDRDGYDPDHRTGDGREGGPA
jgi:carbon storage regulator